jgi:hypothetical protein
MFLGYLMVRTFTVERPEGRYARATGDSRFRISIPSREVHSAEYERYPNKKRECIHGNSLIFYIRF